LGARRDLECKRREENKCRFQRGRKVHAKDRETIRYSERRRSSYRKNSIVGRDMEGDSKYKIGKKSNWPDPLRGVWREKL